MHNKIVNFPAQRTKVTFPSIWWDNCFTPEEVDQIVELCTRGELKDAVTLGETTGIRLSSIKFMQRTNDSAWIFDKLNSVLDIINDRWYGFDLNGYEDFQYTEYTENGHYDWHMDTHLGDEFLPDSMIQPRKLSLSLALNEPGVDFEGGEFQFNLGSAQSTVPLTKGKMVVFPSWLIHRVAPVTKGVRKSLVVWVVGPKFI